MSKSHQHDQDPPTSFVNKHNSITMERPFDSYRGTMACSWPAGPAGLAALLLAAMGSVTIALLALLSSL